MIFLRKLLAPALILLIMAAGSHAQDKRALELTDVMKFRQIRSPQISRDGKWVCFAAVPDRGDPEVQVFSSKSGTEFRLPLGKDAAFSPDARWVAAKSVIPAEKLLRADKKEKDQWKEGLLLLNTRTGRIDSLKQVKDFRFSENSQWLICQHFPENDKTEKESIPLGSNLSITHLESGQRDTIPFVRSFAMDSLSTSLAYVVADTGSRGNGLFIRTLERTEAQNQVLFSDSAAWASELSWNNSTGQLAFLAGRYGEKAKKEEAMLYLWMPGETDSKMVLSDANLARDWSLYPTNKLQWTKDGERLFLGIKPRDEIHPDPEAKADSLKQLFDPEDILEERSVDVWHWNDPLINPQQKKQWEREKDRVYTGVYYPAEERFVTLAGKEVPDLRIPENSHVALGSSMLPYAKRITWDGRYRDYYLLDLKSGEPTRILEEQQHQVSLSPGGRFVLYFRQGDWYLYASLSGESRNLTGDLGRDRKITFSNEDHDYPSDTPGYGIAGWMKNDKAVLIYDKYDIWSFPTAGGEPLCLTAQEGRREKIQFRIQELDREKRWFESGEKVLLSAYHDLLKYTAIYQMQLGKPGVRELAGGEKKHTLIAKAKDGDEILLTRESYEEFPDVWVSDPEFKQTRKISQVNPQMQEFAWGRAELVEWSSMDGTPLQGILVKPAHYIEGEKYPVLVYYYRFFSNRLYDFERLTITHRPNIPFYTSHGYAVFLPDIRFDVGTPGYSATKCLVPGVQKLIDMGVADPDAVCLHGHSWSGYQTAFVITQTDLFKCAIAGAPVSNMTSAYSGIRWGSGMARQFQYEKTQSRIGGSLWEARDKYIENSPVFFADRIQTPLLIMFGDEDDAVPWYQGIELYLALRRLEKDCIFLQYRKEPHHPRTYANKLDCAMKYKQYMDHYLKGEPAADWIREGIPYQGK